MPLPVPSRTAYRLPVNLLSSSGDSCRSTGSRPLNSVVTSNDGTVRPVSMVEPGGAQIGLLRCGQRRLLDVDVALARQVLVPDGELGVLGDTVVLEQIEGDLGVVALEGDAGDLADAHPELADVVAHPQPVGVGEQRGISVTSPRIGFSMVRSTPTRMTAMTAANTPILISSEGMLFTGHLRSG